MDEVNRKNKVIFKSIKNCGRNSVNKIIVILFIKLFSR